MGHALSSPTCTSTAIYVGMARLPQPLVSAVPSVAVELEVDLTTQRIVAVSTNLELPGLQRLLPELLLGKGLTPCLLASLLELEVRYSAPFSTAIATAVRAALMRANRDAASSDATGDWQSFASPEQPLAISRPTERNGHREDQPAISPPNGRNGDTPCH